MGLGLQQAQAVAQLSCVQKDSLAAMGRVGWAGCRAAVGRVERSWRWLQQPDNIPGNQ